MCGYATHVDRKRWKILCKQNEWKAGANIKMDKNKYVCKYVCCCGQETLMGFHDCEKQKKIFFEEAIF